MEMVTTDGRDVVVDDARPPCRPGSDRLHHGVFVDRDGVVAPQVGKSQIGPVLQGFGTLVGSDIEIAEVGSGRVAKGHRQRAGIAPVRYGTREARTGFQSPEVTVSRVQVAGGVVGP